MMEKLACIGWLPMNGFDIIKKGRKKTMLVFEKRPAMCAEFFCLSMNKSNIIRLINAPENVIQVKPFFSLKFLFIL